MLIIKGTQDIFISRGDNKRLAVNLVEKDGKTLKDYVMADSEYLIFRLWNSLMRHEIKQTRSNDGESIVEIAPEFTDGLMGRYAYSVDLVFADGTKETVIGKSPSAIAKFVVLEA